MPVVGIRWCVRFIRAKMPAGGSRCQLLRRAGELPAAFAGQHAACNGYSVRALYAVEHWRLRADHHRRGGGSHTSPKRQRGIRFGRNRQQPRHGRDEQDFRRLNRVLCGGPSRALLVRVPRWRFGLVWLPRTSAAPLAAFLSPRKSPLTWPSAILSPGERGATARCPGANPRSAGRRQIAAGVARRSSTYTSYNMRPFSIFSNASQPKTVQSDPGSDWPVSGYFFFNKNNGRPFCALHVAS